VRALELSLLPVVALGGTAPTAEITDITDITEEASPTSLFARAGRLTHAEVVPAPTVVAPKAPRVPSTPSTVRPVVSARERGRRRVVGAVLSLAPLCLVMLAFDHQGAFTRGSFVRNLLPLTLLAIIGVTYLLAGQGTVARPTWADRPCSPSLPTSWSATCCASTPGRRESSISIALGLVLAASHLVAVGTPTAGQCRRTLRSIAWAGTLYAATFTAANMGLLGSVARPSSSRCSPAS